MVQAVSELGKTIDHTAFGLARRVVWSLVECPAWEHHNRSLLHFHQHRCPCRNRRQNSISCFYFRCKIPQTVVHYIGHSGRHLGDSWTCRGPRLVAYFTHGAADAAVGSWSVVHRDDNLDTDSRLVRKSGCRTGTFRHLCYDPDGLLRGRDDDKTQMAIASATIGTSRAQR